MTCCRRHDLPAAATVRRHDLVFSLQMRTKRLIRGARTVSNPVVSEDDEDDRPAMCRNDIRDESVDEDNDDDPDFEPVRGNNTGFLSSASAEDEPAAPEYRGSVPAKRGCKKSARKSRKNLGKEIYHEFSITFSRLGEDLPESEFHKGAAYVDSVLQWFHCAYEMGDEEGHWHGQCTGGGVGVDKTSVHTGLKNALGWTGQNRCSAWNLVAKYLSYKNKVHTKQGMIGYCHKNVKNYEHPVFRSKNVSEKDIRTGLDTYLLYGSSELKLRMNLTQRIPL
ncbi:hypothetical protein CYMTET_46586 [Cymbomonas tetramitiformis]|uniref:Replitron HUH endonuclease domain-containing protein n=1 Tax=Cymbomonas tetramitiformis TaxID=36881 RepID=A0AAE0BX90_9CHLO|nr:hypothetical protein CYMTET_46586 [Cymbomonas tetramitiformis]